MKPFKPTDEELLAYLMEDCDENLKFQISEDLKNNAVLKKRLEIITFLKNEIKNMPIVYKLKSNKRWGIGPLARQLILGSCIFVLGLFVESNFELIPNSNQTSSDANVQVSKQLSWDEVRSSSLM